MGHASSGWRGFRVKGVIRFGEPMGMGHAEMDQRLKIEAQRVEVSSGHRGLAGAIVHLGSCHKVILGLTILGPRSSGSLAQYRPTRCREAPAALSLAWSKRSSRYWVTRSIWPHAGLALMQARGPVVVAYVSQSPHGCPPCDPDGLPGLRPVCGLGHAGLRGNR